MAEKSDEKTRLDINAFACIFGDNDAEVTPVPIPNTVVKLCSADDTWREAAWESRSSPEQKRERNVRSFFCSAKFAYGELNVLCTLNYFVAKLPAAATRWRI